LQGLDYSSSCQPLTMFLDSRSNSVLGFVFRVDVGDVGFSELYGPRLHGVRTQEWSSFQQLNTVVAASP
jgi:hypothetical protein